MIDNNEEYTLKTQEFYLERIQGVNEGNSDDIIAQNVGWNSQANQYLGFAVATTFSNIDWQNVNSVLDVGCGYGNLVAYLRENQDFQGEYTGIDILPEFINAAKNLYGDDGRNKFIQGNFLTYEWQESYDVVISLGIIAINYDQPKIYGVKSRDYANQAIILMMKLANLAMSVYFPNEENTPGLDRLLGYNMAFYQPGEIQFMIENASDKKYASLTIESYPDVNDSKSIAKVCFV
jgi:SAM-dependent methyltransferase